jgi:hypothetical protein
VADRVAHIDIGREQSLENRGITEAWEADAEAGKWRQLGVDRVPTPA